MGETCRDFEEDSKTFKIFGIFGLSCGKYG
nr:MAG TPA: hypothetical protein [Caudoviricetes sp.]